MGFFCLFVLFRSPAGRLATGWLPRMQSEKRLRGNTFCVDPDSGADSHGRRSVSSRWQWSRSHFVQTNNTAVSLSSSQRAHRPGSGSRYVTPDQPKQQTLTPPTALRPAPTPVLLSEPPQRMAGLELVFQGNCWSMQQILCASKRNECEAV